MLAGHALSSKTAEACGLKAVPPTKNSQLKRNRSINASQIAKVSVSQATQKNNASHRKQIYVKTTYLASRPLLGWFYVQVLLRGAVVYKSSPQELELWHTRGQQNLLLKLHIVQSCSIARTHKYRRACTDTCTR